MEGGTNATSAIHSCLLQHHINQSRQTRMDRLGHSLRDTGELTGAGGIPDRMKTKADVCIRRCFCIRFVCWWSNIILRKNLVTSQPNGLIVVVLATIRVGANNIILTGLIAQILECREIIKRAKWSRKRGQTISQAWSKSPGQPNGTIIAKTVGRKHSHRLQTDSTFTYNTWCSCAPSSD